MLDDVFRGHDARLTEELERRLHEHYLVAAGPQEVINALRSGQVGYRGYVVLSLIGARWRRVAPGADRSSRACLRPVHSVRERARR